MTSVSGYVSDDEVTQKQSRKRPLSSNNEENPDVRLQKGQEKENNYRLRYFHNTTPQTHLTLTLDSEKTGSMCSKEINLSCAM